MQTDAAPADDKADLSLSEIALLAEATRRALRTAGSDNARRRSVGIAILEAFAGGVRDCELLADIGARAGPAAR